MRVASFTGPLRCGDSATKRIGLSPHDFGKSGRNITPTSMNVARSRQPPNGSSPLSP